MILHVVRGASADWELQAATRTGVVAAGFLETDPISARFWPGGDQAVLFAPRVVWTDAPTGKFRVSIDDGQTDDLDEGPFHLEVSTTRDGRTAVLAVVNVWIDDAPGDKAAPLVYCTTGDLAGECGWVTGLLDLEGDAAGAVVHRAAARDWLNGLVLNAWDGGGASSAFPGVPTATTAGGLLSDPWLAELLETRGVMLEGPRGRAVRRACALYAGALIARAQPGEQTAKYAAHFFRRARAAAACLIVEIDADGDGKADMAVSLGSANMRRG